METYEQELEKIKADAEEKRKALESKYSVLNLIAVDDMAEYEPPRVHRYKLYGAMGTVKWEGTEYESLRKGKQPDADLLIAVLAKFPPIGRVRVKDGCTSFRPPTAEIGRSEEWNGDLYDCYGINVRIKTFQRTVAEFNWYSRLENGELWQFEVALPLWQCNLGTLSMRAERYGQDGPIKRWSVCQFHPRHELHAQTIRWGTGGPEYPNDFTLYWDVDSGKALFEDAEKVREVASRKVVEG